MNTIFSFLLDKIIFLDIITSEVLFSSFTK